MVGLVVTGQGRRKGTGEVIPLDVRDHAVGDQRVKRLVGGGTGIGSQIRFERLNIPVNRFFDDLGDLFGDFLFELVAAVDMRECFAPERFD